MNRKPTYDELEKKIHELEEEALACRRIADALRNSEERFRIVADSTYDWETWRGTDGRYVYVSPSCERITGYRREDFMDDPWLIERIAHPEDRPIVSKHFREDFGKGDVGHTDFRVLSRDGEERWISHYCQPIYGSDGSWLGRRCSNRDLTGRKLAEKALLESKEKYRTLVDQSLQGIGIAQGPPPRLVFANPAMADILGYTIEELTTLSPEEVEAIIHPEDRSFFFKRFEDRLKGKTVPNRYEVRGIRKDGGTISLEISANRIEYRGLPAVQAVFVDITKWKRAEEALELTGEEYRTLFNDSRDAIYMTTREGRFLNANQALLDLFGFSREELIGGLNVREMYVDPRDRVQFQKQIEARGAVRNYEVTFQKKDGTKLDCLLTSSVRRSGAGSILGYQGIIRDVTRRKHAEKALRESEAHYRAMVDAFDGLMYICSPDYRVEFMNQKLIDRTGYDATGEFCYKALHNLESICPWCVNERVFSGETVRCEVQSTKDDRWYYIVNTPIHHTDGRISKQAMILDITERKEMEEALRRSSEKTKRFAYSVSHDLKSPAVSLYGLANRLLKTYGDLLDEKGRIYFHQILTAAEQISALVEQINLYISASEAPLTIEGIKLQGLVRMIKEEFSPQLSVRQIAWTEPDTLPDIHADRLSILRMMRNLVDNALKYGGDDLSEIRIGYKETEEFHVLSVSNDGAVIDAEDIDKIFGPFQRHSASKGVDGTGLGLAIVKESAEKHGGRVWVESAPEKWTTFYISISNAL